MRRIHCCGVLWYSTPKVARSYLTERNLATAIPPVFSKLELLGEAIGIVKGRLANASTVEQPAATALSGYVDETVVGNYSLA